MIFAKTNLSDTFVIDPETLNDERGFFARTWCKKEFKSHGLNGELVQCSISFNKKKGTLRGMHYQAPPYEETRLVRCTQGAIHDVIIDLRPDSSTYKRHLAIALTAENRKMIYVPPGLAHGFLTLEDNTEVFYQMSEYYEPTSTRGIRWDDTTFGIKWPIEIQLISSRDQNYPNFNA